jgi:hypothetical protein
VDAAFGVHHNLKRHTGATCTLGSGIIISTPIKQKNNARSSTKSELIAVDDIISKEIWMKLFLEYQSNKKLLITIYQDN